MGSQYQSRLFSSSLSSSSSHSHSHSPFSSSSPLLSPREIKQEKGIREEDWIMGEDGGPTSFQPPRLETSPPLAEGFPCSFQPPLRKPCRPLREPLPKRGNNVSYPRITGWTNSRSPLPSRSINRDIHQYSDDCFCFWCEDERDAIPDTLNTRRLPANPIVAHEFLVNCPCLSCEDRREETMDSGFTRQQPNPSLNLLSGAQAIPRTSSNLHHYSVNCPCSSCEERRVEILGSPTTRQQPNPYLDLVPRDSIPVLLSPELPEPNATAALSPTLLPPDNSQDSYGFFCDNVRIENRGSFSPEPAPIQPAVQVVPAISGIRRNPSRRAKEKALVGIRECIGKKIVACAQKSRGGKSAVVRYRRMRELISPSSAERELTQMVSQKRGHFQSLLNIFEEGVVEHLKENGDSDLPRSMVASPQILAWNETSREGVEEKNKITELTVAFKFISYT